MKRTLLCGVIMVAIAGITGATRAETGMAKATLHDASGKEVGHARFNETSKGLQVTVDVHGLPVGTHAAHIHEVGKCEAPDFKSAGGHFNPEGKHHGHKNPQGWHAGDLPNLTVGTNGKGHATWVLEDLSVLRHDASDILTHAGGTSIVIHANADDEMSDPAGNAGNRIACGVILH